MIGKTGLAMAMLLGSIISPRASLAQEQSHYQIGIVYYASDGDFRAMDKEAAHESGRSNYSARVKGAHATIRLRADQPQVFRVCSVDPGRFKLYRFKSDGNARTLIIAKNNIWIGGSKNVLSESEVPVTIQAMENGCFKLTPQTSLGGGEFGFSPVGDSDAFMFGVGDIERSK